MDPLVENSLAKNFIFAKDSRGQPLAATMSLLDLMALDICLTQKAVRYFFQITPMTNYYI